MVSGKYKNPLPKRVLIGGSLGQNLWTDSSLKRPTAKYKVNKTQVSMNHGIELTCSSAILHH